MKTIILHVGFLRSGSNLFQQICFDNQDILKQESIIYPTLKNRPFHGEYVTSLIQNKSFKFPPPELQKRYTYHNTALWQSTITDFKNSNNRHLIISCEWFSDLMRSNSGRNILASLKDQIEIDNDLQLKVAVFCQPLTQYFLEIYTNRVFDDINFAVRPEVFCSTLLQQKSFHLEQITIFKRFEKIFPENVIKYFMYDNTNQKQFIHNIFNHFFTPHLLSKLEISIPPINTSNNSPKLLEAKILHNKFSQLNQQNLSYSDKLQKMLSFIKFSPIVEPSVFSKWDEKISKYYSFFETIEPSINAIEQQSPSLDELKLFSNQKSSLDFSKSLHALSIFR